MPKGMVTVVGCIYGGMQSQVLICRYQDGMEADYLSLGDFVDFIFPILAVIEGSPAMASQFVFCFFLFSTDVGMLFWM